MAQTDSREAKSSLRPYGRTSLILGLIGPVAFLLLFLFVRINSFGEQASLGMGGLGLASLFVFIIGILLFVSVPLGIAAIFFGVHALTVAKKENAKNTAGILGIIMGCLDIVVPIILFFLTIFPR